MIPRPCLLFHPCSVLVGGSGGPINVAAAGAGIGGNLVQPKPRVKTAHTITKILISNPRASKTAEGGAAPPKTQNLIMRGIFFRASGFLCPV